MPHFLPPVYVKITPDHKDAGQNSVSYLKRGPSVGEKALGSKNL